MDLFPFPLLVGDIGGTNARFALIVEPGAAISDHEHRGTHDFPDLQSAIADVLPHLPARPRSAVVCAAGPVEGHHVTMTNANWLIDGDRVAAALGLEQGIILNDFEAQALSLPVIRREWMHEIGSPGDRGRSDGRPGRDRPVGDKPGARFVLGPGTGLGAAALLEVGGRHFALASEAGHVDFGPVGDAEMAIWPHLEAGPHGRISAETVLSGPGLARLHRARLAALGRPAPLIDQSAIVERAKADPGGEEGDTARLFWSLAARYAGNMAITFLATGGVTFCGGVLPRLIGLLDAAAFRARFEDRAPFDAVLRDVPTAVVTIDDTVLHGLAALAAEPGRYALDFERRCWC